MQFISTQISLNPAENSHDSSTLTLDWLNSTLDKMCSPLWLTLFLRCSGRDGSKQDLQGAGCQSREWTTDGGLWEAGQWCEHTPTSSHKCPAHPLSTLLSKFLILSRSLSPLLGGCCSVFVAFSKCSSFSCNSIVSVFLAVNQLSGFIWSWKQSVYFHLFGNFRLDWHNRL